MVWPSGEATQLRWFYRLRFSFLQVAHAIRLSVSPYGTARGSDYTAGISLANELPARASVR
jgi:hypothetical protein